MNNNARFRCATSHALSTGACTTTAYYAVTPLPFQKIFKNLYTPSPYRCPQP